MERLTDGIIDVYEQFFQKGILRPEEAKRLFDDLRYYKKLSEKRTNAELLNLTAKLEEVSSALFDWFNTFCDHESVEKSWVEETEKLLESTQGDIHQVRGTKPEWK